MAEDELAEDEAPKKKGPLIPLLLGVILAGAAGFGGFWAVSNGVLFGTSSGDSASTDAEASDGEEAGQTGAEGSATLSRVALEDVAFVALEPLVINLGGGAAGRHLIFSAELEVAPGDTEAVEHLMPRVLDVLNSYLRLLEMEELTDPRTLVRLRAQMLRRIQIVTGDTLVRDLLVTEFVVN